MNLTMNDILLGWWNLSHSRISPVVKATYLKWDFIKALESGNSPGAFCCKKVSDLKVSVESLLIQNWIGEIIDNLEKKKSRNKDKGKQMSIVNTLGIQ